MFFLFDNRELLKSSHMFIKTNKPVSLLTTKYKTKLLFVHLLQSLCHSLVHIHRPTLLELHKERICLEQDVFIPYVISEKM